MYFLAVHRLYWYQRGRQTRAWWWKRDASISRKR